MVSDGPPRWTATGRWTAASPASRTSAGDDAEHEEDSKELPQDRRGGREPRGQVRDPPKGAGQRSPGALDGGHMAYACIGPGLAVIRWC